MVCAVTYAEKGEKGSLPAAIEAAVKALLPNGVISESKQEEEIKVYEVEVKVGDKESDVKLAEDGTVIDVESDETIDTVPPAVAAAIKAQNAEVNEVSREVEYAKVQVVKLDKPIITYSADVIKDGKKIEIEIAADGTIIKQQEAEEKKCDKEKDDDNKKKDDDDDEKGEHQD
jgi:hypothetical protein